MYQKRIVLYASLGMALVLLAGCTMPASKGPTVIPSAAVTQAVQTMAAKLTATLPADSQPTVTATLAPATAKPATPTSNSPAPSATPALQNTATQAGTNTPVVTLNPSDPAAGLGNPEWHEAFDGTSAWYLYSDEFIQFQAQDNQLNMTAFQANNRNGWALVPQLASAKYYVEMTATFGSACKDADHFGLMISPVSSADKGYLFGISCDGKFILWKWDGTRMATLSKWKASDLLQSGPNQTNRIGIKVAGNKLGLYANGDLLTEVTDPTYDKLYFGIFIGAAETANFKVQVNGLNYWSLP